MIPNSRPWITEDDKRAVMDVLDSGDLMSGKQVQAFEEELAAYLGRKYVVCVNSGTAALTLSRRLVPHHLTGAFGFIATATSIGRDVMFYDGPCDSHVLGEVLPQGSTKVVDAAQAFCNNLTPSLADCFSFNANKPICCIGGCVATNSLDIYAIVESNRNHGRDGCGFSHRHGGNYRMPETNAALGRSQLRRIQDINYRRLEVAEWYAEHLPDWCERAAWRASWFLYPIEIDNRDEVHLRMCAAGVQTRSCADWLLPVHPIFGYKAEEFPNAKRRADRTLLLPLFPTMTEAEVITVCKELEIARDHSRQDALASVS